ncbi:hypothetical protein [Bradyrhizobium sp. Ai1a-2]|uniref:hypothetical protein n=1 Tax=Bradyrhizobium sp. Ai1a-2 TaxID=196490 RepID=UPI0003F767E0|nr:hypothetical protein [Bradyrhizobium sp. Ai1a-2]
MAEQDFNYFRNGGWLKDCENFKDGGRLTTKERKALPKSDFALPGGRYPVNDENHARNALARVSQHGSPEEKAKVRAKVHRKYPDIEQND